MLTLTRLKEALNYDPETGVFTWVNPTNDRIQVGSVAGDKFKDCIRIGLDGEGYRAHRLAWLYCYGEWPKHNIDHINGNHYDNRIANLRDVPQSENVRNQRLRKDNKSGYHGVNWDKGRNKWRVTINVEGKVKTLGRYDDLDEAIKVRKEAEIELNYHSNHGRK